MKKLIHILACIVLSIGSSTAQNRIHKYFCADGCTKPVSQKQPPTFYPAPLNGYYFEGFESTFPPMGWQTVDVLDTPVTWNSSNTADLPAAFEGLQSAYCRYEFNTPSSGEDWLITPQFSVSPGDSFSFQFKLEYFGYPPDSTFILISTTDSALSSFTTVLDFYAEGLNYPTDSANWYYKTHSLNAFAGQNIYIAFKNVNNEGDGVFIDNVEIGTRPAAEVGIVSIDTEPYISTGLYTPRATVQNNGSATQTFNVTMNITGGYTDTQPVTLAPMASATVLFNTWNATLGTYTFSVQTFLAGDANPANDTASISVKVLESFINYGWSVHDPLVDPTFGSAVASVNSSTGSRLFLLGGYGQLTILPDAYEYDLNFLTWAGISPMPIECTYAASATANGKIFVFGGRTLGAPQGATQIYDYITDTWSSGSPMPLPVVTAAFATYKDSLVYIIGGLIDATGAATNLVQIYNTYTDTWTNGTIRPGQAVYSLRGGIVNNKIIIAGGFNPQTSLAIGTTYVGEIDTLNPTQITWTQVDDHPAGKISRGGTGVSLDKNSGLVVFAGGSLENSIYSTTDKTFAYDLNSNSWKLGPDKPTSRNLFYMAPIVENDSIYLVAFGGNPTGTQLFHSDSHEWLNLGYYQFPTGIDEENLLNDAFKIYPNPADDKITLHLNLNTTFSSSVIIKNTLGQLVMEMDNIKLSTQQNSIIIPVKDFAKGMYYCKVKANGSYQTKKFIKN